MNNKAANTIPRSILSTYVKHLGVLLFIAVMILLGLVALLKHQIAPYFYADLYEEVSTSYKAKADSIALALIQNNVSRAVSLISESDFVPNALSKKFLAYSPSNEDLLHQTCTGKFTFRPWGQACLTGEKARIQIPIRSGDNTLGFVQVDIAASLSKWLPFERLVQGVYFSLATLLAISGILGLLFFRSLVFPVKRAMKQIQDSRDEQHFESILTALPFQELFLLASRLAAKSSELNRARIDLEKARHREELAELAAQVSHDVQSPLLALIKLTEEPEKLPVAEQARLIGAAAHRLKDMTGGLLHKYRGEVDGPSLKNSDLKKIIDSTLEEKRAEIGALQDQSIKLQFDSRLSTLKVALPDSELSRILSNLINNSLEATKDTALPQVVISVEISEKLGFLKVSVRDNGDGMSPEVLKKVRTVGGSYQKSGGTGLGLSHAKEVMNKFGGFLSIDSDEHQGTVVTLELPLSNSKPFAEHSKGSTSPDLILIDDDDNIRDIWKMEAHLNGLSILSVSNEDEILFESVPKDVPIFVDKNLGNGKSGIDICERLHTLGFTQLFLATGDRGFNAPPYVSVVGKSFPDGPIKSEVLHL